MREVEAGGHQTRIEHSVLSHKWLACRRVSEQICHGYMSDARILTVLPV